MAALEWEGVGTTHKATTYKFIKFMVYACPHCDTYYDASLQPLANDKATLARRETKGIMREMDGRRGTLCRPLKHWRYKEDTKNRL
jgi:hypothetical protein